VSAAEPPDQSEPPTEPEPPTPGAIPTDAPAADAPPAADALPADALPTDATRGDATPGATWSAATSGTVLPPQPVTPAVVDTWTPPPTKPKRKLTWLWVLLGALVLIATLVVVAVVLFIRTISGPIDATNDVLAQIKAQRYEAAYALACSKDRDQFTVDQYGQAFRDTVTERGAITEYDVDYSSVDGSTAEVRYDITFANGDTLRLETEVRKENGTWKACLLQR
jgi:hypothetical protein